MEFVNLEFGNRKEIEETAARVYVVFPPPIFNK